MPSSATARLPVNRVRAREERVIALLLAGKPVLEICSEIPISRSALWRMRQTPAFQERLKQARQECFDSVVAVLHESAVTFARTLVAVCDDPKSRDSARATAARSGLDSLWRATELFDFEQRLRKLEQTATGGEEPTERSAPTIQQPPPKGWTSPEEREQLERERGDQ